MEPVTYWNKEMETLPASKRKLGRITAATVQGAHAVCL
jgi:hypothetical protein